MTLSILEYFSTQLDFRFLTKDSTDGNWGSPEVNSTYFNGCVGELQRGEVSVAAGPFTITAARDEVIDFSVPLFEESNAILLPRPAPESKLWRVFSPFTMSVWLSIVAALFVTTFATWVLAYFSPFTAYNLNLEFAIADEVWLQEYLWSAIGSFLQQGQDFYPFAMSSRTAMAFWWLLSVIICGAFNGDLTAHLTVTVTHYPIKTLDDLTGQTEIRPYVIAGTSLHTLLLNAESGVYKKITESMVELGPYDDCPTDPERIVLNFTMAEELFLTAPIALMLPDDAFYAELFNFHMQKLHETGQLQRWFQLYWSSDSVCSVGSSAETDAISLESAGGCFIATLCFYGLGLLILLVELVWTKLAKRQPLDCFFY
uniref:PBPe domain-containing protein n=1 Tax=Macrostomum lignano TaxID=282301 RepID=A0A1I8H5G6_9PLAT